MFLCLALYSFLLTVLSPPLAAVAAALVGGGMAVLLAGLPLKLGLVAAALVGILAGMAVDLGWYRRLKAGLFHV